MMQQTWLCDGKPVPALLRDAFQALARDAPSAETVARVERSLETHVARTRERATSRKRSAGELMLLLGVNWAPSMPPDWRGARGIFLKRGAYV